MLIKLTALAYDEPIWINPNLVTAVEAREENGFKGTVIYFDRDNEVKVRETLDEIGAKWPA